MITTRRDRILSWSDEANDYVPLSESTRFEVNTGTGFIEVSTLDAAKHLIDKNRKAWKTAAIQESRRRFADLNRR